MSDMRGMSGHGLNDLQAAQKAALGLAWDKLREHIGHATMAAISVHAAVQDLAPRAKSAVFYKHFWSWRRAMVEILAAGFKRLYGIGLAHRGALQSNPEQWTWQKFHPLAGSAVAAIYDWYVLACDGANQWVQPLAQVELVSSTPTISIPLRGKPVEIVSRSNWRAPAWLFGISAEMYGIGRLAREHMPDNNSDGKLSAAHTRLLLLGTRKVFLLALSEALETARNEAIAAAGAVSASPSPTPQRGPNKRKGYEIREKLYQLIQRILTENPSLEGTEFCRELDRHHAQPLYDWRQNGQWRNGQSFQEAWEDSPLLRKRIRRVRQEAMKLRR